MTIEEMEEKMINAGMTISAPNGLPRIGFDFGDTIVRIDGIDGEKSFRGPTSWLAQEFPDAVTTIGKLVSKFGSLNSFIISRVKFDGKEKTLQWLDYNWFCLRTGLWPRHVLFCDNKADKGPMAALMGLTHFVDNRAEVLVKMPSVPHRFLFCPDPVEMLPWEDKLAGVTMVSSWDEIARLIL